MKFKWTAIFSASSPLILLFSWLLTTAGSVLPLVFFYPGLFLLGVPIGDTFTFTWTILQFPVYGLIWDLSKLRSSQKLAWASIAIIHLTLIIVAMNTIDY